MNINRILKSSAYALMLATVPACFACSDDKDLDPEVETVEIVAPAYAMLRENIRVNTANVASGYDVTVNFGDGTVQTCKSGLNLYHTYTRPGNYTITMSAASYITGTRNLTVSSKPGLTEVLNEFRDPECRKVLVVAHRAHTTDPTIPENTTKAIDAAIEAGADLVEIDVFSTTDRVLVVTHDHELTLPTGERKDVRNCTYDEIRDIELTDRNGNPTGEHIPLFEDILLHGRGRIYFNLDKIEYCANYSDVLNMIDKTGMWDSVIFYGGKSIETLTFNPSAHCGCWEANASTFGTSTSVHYTQGSYFPSNSSLNTNLSSGVSLGYIPYINLLHVGDTNIPEYSLDESQLDELLRIWPTTGFIQCDVPELLVPALEARGRR